MCEFEFCLVEELCEDLLAMRMRDYLGRLEDWTEDWKLGRKIGRLDGRCGMRDDDQSSFSIY